MEARPQEPRESQRPLVIETREEYTRKAKPEPGMSIKIENLPFSVDTFQLRKAFKDFGRVTECVVPENERGQSRGFGVVEFDSKDSALSAKKVMDRAKFNGREIQVHVQ